MMPLKLASEGADLTDWSRLFQTVIPVKRGLCLKHSVVNQGATREFKAWRVL